MPLLLHRRMIARGIANTEEPRGAAIGIEEFPARFDEEMRSLPASVDRVILSEERLSMFQGADDLAALKAFLAPYFDDFKIVVYLRSQDSYLASRYSELLRMGVMDGPDNVVATPERLSHHDYLALIDRWAAVFGAGAIVPRLYERGAGKVFDSVDDFLGVCGISLQVASDDPSKARNPSMSFAGQQLMLRMADLVRKETGDNRLRGGVWFEISAAVTAAMPGNGWLPTRDEAAAFMKRFEAGNEVIRQRYFPDRQTLFSDGAARFPVKPMEVSDQEIGDAAMQAFLKAASRAAVKERPAARPVENHCGAPNAPRRHAEHGTARQQGARETKGSGTGGVTSKADRF